MLEQGAKKLPQNQRAQGAKARVGARKTKVEKGLRSWDGVAKGLFRGRRPRKDLVRDWPIWPEKVQQVGLPRRGICKKFSRQEAAADSQAATRFDFPAHNHRSEQTCPAVCPQERTNECVQVRPKCFFLPPLLLLSSSNQPAFSFGKAVRAAEKAPWPNRRVYSCVSAARTTKFYTLPTAAFVLESNPLSESGN